MLVQLPNGENFRAVKREFKPPITKDERQRAREEVIASRRAQLKAYQADSTQGHPWNPVTITFVSERDLMAQITYNRGVEQIPTQLVDAESSDNLPRYGGQIGWYDQPHGPPLKVMLYVGNGNVDRIIIRELLLVLEIPKEIRSFWELDRYMWLRHTLRSRRLAKILMR